MTRTWGWRGALACFALAAAASVPVPAQVSLVRVGSIPGPATWVEARGQYAYVAADGTFTIVDVGDPAAPKRLRHSLMEQRR